MSLSTISAWPSSWNTYILAPLEEQGMVDHFYEMFDACSNAPVAPSIQAVQLLIYLALTSESTLPLTFLHNLLTSNPPQILTPYIPRPNSPSSSRTSRSNRYFRDMAGRSNVRDEIDSENQPTWLRWEAMGGWMKKAKRKLRACMVDGIWGLLWEEVEVEVRKTHERGGGKAGDMGENQEEDEDEEEEEKEDEEEDEDEYLEEVVKDGDDDDYEMTHDREERKRRVSSHVDQRTSIHKKKQSKMIKMAMKMTTKTTAKGATKEKVKKKTSKLNDQVDKVKVRRVSANGWGVLEWLITLWESAAAAAAAESSTDDKDSSETSKEPKQSRHRSFHNVQPRPPSTPFLDQLKRPHAELQYDNASAVFDIVRHAYMNNHDDLVVGSEIGIGLVVGDEIQVEKYQVLAIRLVVLLIDLTRGLSPPFHLGTFHITFLSLLNSLPLVSLQTFLTYLRTRIPSSTLAHLCALMIEDAAGLRENLAVGRMRKNDWTGFENQSWSFPTPGYTVKLLGMESKLNPISTMKSTSTSQFHSQTHSQSYFKSTSRSKTNGKEEEMDLEDDKQKEPFGNEKSRMDILKEYLVITCCSSDRADKWEKAIHDSEIMGDLVHVEEKFRRYITAITTG